MNVIHRILSWKTALVFLFFHFSSLASAQQPKATAILASDIVVTQEATVLRISISNAEIYGWPETPRVAPLTFKQGSTGFSIINGRRTRNLDYAVSSYRAGLFKIPSFKINTNKGMLTTEPLILRVFDENQLKEQIAEIENTTSQLPYFCGTFIVNPNPYVGEEQQVMLKLFIPQGIRIQEPQLAEIETKNLAAWRFENRDLQGSYERGGKHYQSLTYFSTVAGLKAGSATLGPGKVEPVIQGRARGRGLFGWQSFNIRFDFPTLEMDIKPLPSPIPLGFSGAVGNFQLTALPSAQELELGESLTVDIAVTGSGNLDKLAAPELLADEEEWKTFDAIRQTQGTERRKANGTVHFNHVIRPLRKVEELPPYRLVFFDPVIEEYRTIKSAPYPLVVRGSSSMSSLSASPLVALTPGKLKTLSTIPIWLWQIIPAGLTLAALGLGIRRHFSQRKMAAIPKQEFEQDLAKIKDAASKGRPEFYRAIGRFLEHWPHSQIQNEAGELLATRDDICFSPQKEEEQVLPKERSKVLKLLKNCAPIILAFITFMPAPAEASIEALWNDKKYQEGADFLKAEIKKNPTPTAYYNLGVFEEKLERPGKALLAYYRALASDSSLDTERPLELATKTGAITKMERKTDDWLAHFSQKFYREIFILGIWLIILAFASKTLLKSFSTPRWEKLSFITCLTLAPIALLAGGLAWWFYPEEKTYLSLLEGSVVMNVEPLKNSPHSEGESFREIPAGSLGFVTAERGNWSFIEFPKGLNGWLPKASLRQIAGNEL